MTTTTQHFYPLPMHYVDNIMNKDPYYHELQTFFLD